MNQDTHQNSLPKLSNEERATYEWQMWTAGFGEEGQRRLKAATVLVSRAGGLGGVTCYELAAAGIGRLIIAHGGNIRHSDLNRQLLMTHDMLGQPRIGCLKRRLRELNPRLEVIGIAENISPGNAHDLVAQADVVVDAAPLFVERYAMNDACVRLGKPMVEAAMYEWRTMLTTIIPGQSPCLRCLWPEEPALWRRQFPVFGAVSGSVACLAAVEVIKLISGLGKPLAGRLLQTNTATMRQHIASIERDPNCPVCAHMESKT